MLKAPQKHEVTVNGNVFTRTSKTHTYTHVIVATKGTEWVAVSWAGSASLAEKKAASERGMTFYGRSTKVWAAVHVVPVGANVTL